MKATRVRLGNTDLEVSRLCFGTEHIVYHTSERCWPGPTTSMV